MKESTSPREVEVVTADRVDLTLVHVLLLFLAVLAFGLGTRSGNTVMCREGWAPTFIDCTRASVP